MLVNAVFIVFNMERTIRSSIGDALAIEIHGSGSRRVICPPIYMAANPFSFSTLHTRFGTTFAMALLAANLLFAFSLARGRSLNVDVYFSRATIQNSLTIILAGIYLLAVGLLAHLSRLYIPREVQSLSLDAFIVFVSLMGLAVLLLSNRLRRQIRQFVTRHFGRPIYDYRSVWMNLTKRLLDDGYPRTQWCHQKLVSESRKYFRQCLAAG
jgi:hypothetical protein